MLTVTSQPSVNATPEAGYFFQRCLAVPIVVCLYLFWKAYSGNWGLYIPLQEINLMSGACLLEVGNEGEIPARTWRNLPRRVLRILF
jgi:amino acid transporter